MQARYDDFHRNIILIDASGKSALIDPLKYVLRKQDGEEKPSSCTSEEVLSSLDWQSPSVEVRPLFE